MLSSIGFKWFLIAGNIKDEVMTDLYYYGNVDIFDGFFV